MNYQGRAALLGHLALTAVHEVDAGNLKKGKLSTFQNFMKQKLWLPANRLFLLKKNTLLVHTKICHISQKKYTIKILTRKNLDVSSNILSS